VVPCAKAERENGEGGEDWDQLGCVAKEREGARRSVRSSEGGTDSERRRWGRVAVEQAEEARCWGHYGSTRVGRERREMGRT
jgi:hypothetical protein